MNTTEEVRLSKLMSYFLRHRPEEAGLTLDQEGMVALGDLLAAIRQRDGYGWATQDDVRAVVAASDKQRFQLHGDRIGARYGHNKNIVEVEPGEPVTPPDILYHGTPRGAVPSILATGLQPRQRQFVHMAATVKSARMVGARRDEEPVILLIRALAAHEAGLLFYAPTAETYLTRHVPPAYIEIAPPSE